MDIPKWRVLASSYVVESPFMRLRKDTIELPSGTIIDDYYVRESRGFSAVFALTPRNEVVLVRQFKYGIGRIILELPSGFIDEGEAPRDAAIRELAEETGCVADSIDFVRTLVADPTNSRMLMHLFIARGARARVQPKFDATEEIEVELVTLDRLRDHLHSGEIESATQVAAIYTILDKTLAV
jgi:ADP-ribose pyrophosphatase